MGAPARRADRQPGAENSDPTHALLASNLFGFVESATFRFWQPLDRPRLRDLVLSRSNIALLGEIERERVLRKVDELYDAYGRGADGMLLPYVTRCYKAVVRPPAVNEPGRPDGPTEIHATTAATPTPCSSTSSRPVGHGVARGGGWAVGISAPRPTAPRSAPCTPPP